MKKMKQEGMIAKRKDSKCHKGKRTSDWLKIKNIQGQEAIIVGFTDPKGSRKYFGSLLLAVRKKGKLVPIGNVGTGFTDKILKELHAKLTPLMRKTSPLDVSIKETADIIWVNAELSVILTLLRSQKMEVSGILSFKAYGWVSLQSTWY